MSINLVFTFSVIENGGIDVNNMDAPISLFYFVV
jgi:hypothetical protein